MGSHKQSDIMNILIFAFLFTIGHSAPVAQGPSEVVATLNAASSSLIASSSLLASDSDQLPIFDQDDVADFVKKLLPDEYLFDENTGKIIEKAIEQMQNSIKEQFTLLKQRKKAKKSKQGKRCKKGKKCW